MNTKTNLFNVGKRMLDKRANNPFYLICYVTNKCNLTCEHCFYSAELNNSQKDELTLEEYEKISKNMGKVLFMSLTGGEPFLRRDVAQIAELFCKNNGVRKLAIPTNGTFTKQVVEGVRYILENCKNTSLDINISIDGIGKDHNDIRGQKDSFERATNTYKALAELKKEFNKLGISILATVTSQNQDKMEEIQAYVKKEFPQAVFSVNLIRGTPKNPQISNVDIKKYENIASRIINGYQSDKFNKNAPLAKISASKNALRADIISKTYKNNKFISQCYAAQLSGVMYENGDVFPCELLDEDKKIGNIRDFDYNFKKLWNSEKATEVIKYIKDTKCFCTHECFWSTNILFNLKHYPKLLLESSKL
ncbi:MAG: hypothetical protein CMH64_00315 [Nanoarchaeota archaeon]|nr:hypothetical protein [Nanoarchaeota archaeon]